jgi:hypothetical protein
VLKFEEKISGIKGLFKTKNAAAHSYIIEITRTL